MTETTQQPSGPMTAKLALVTSAKAAKVQGHTRLGHIRRWLAQHLERRQLEATKIRLAETAPHLLYDAGLEDERLAPAFRPRQTMATPPAGADKPFDFAIAAE